MRGVHGLIIVTFGTMFALARWFDLGGLRELNTAIVQAIWIMSLYGAALLVVALCSRIYRGLVALTADAAAQEKNELAWLDYQRPR